MSLLCRLGKHRPLPSSLWNQGYFFSRCGRCGCDLVRRGPDWSAVPKGYRVVWKQRLGPPIDWTPWSPAKGEYHPRLSELLAADEGGEVFGSGGAELAIDFGDAGDAGELIDAPVRSWVTQACPAEPEWRRA